MGGLFENQEVFPISGFTVDQIEEISKGIDAGMKVGIYAKYEFLAIQMRQIRLGMEEGIPVDLYARTEYDWFQMEEIRLGLKEGIDVNCYADPGISHDIMRQLRLGLKEEIDLTNKIGLGAEILKQLRLAAREKIDLIPYVDAGYQADQLEAIRMALEEGNSLDPYIDPLTPARSMHEIRKGLQSKVEVSAYTGGKYDHFQMRQIRLGMEENLDVEDYLNADYNWRQMEELRLGLRSGLKIAKYNSLMYTENEMKKIRKEIEDSYEDQNEEEIILEDAGVRLRISAQSAKICFERIEDEMDQEKVIRILKENQVVFGIIEAAICECLQEKIIGEWITVAKGQDAIDGQDGWYEKVREFKEDEWIPVTEGEILLLYHRARNGVEALSVKGEHRLAKRGMERPVLKGEGFLITEDKTAYLAAVTGMARMQEGRLIVRSCKKLEAGKIEEEFNGLLWIMGDVGAGSRIRAAEVIVNGNIKQSRIESEGDVVAKDISNTKICAGHNVYAHRCESCRIDAKGILQMRGEDAAIVGGEIYARYGVRTIDLGNEQHIKTRIYMGVNRKMLQKRRKINEEQKEIQKELMTLLGEFNEWKRRIPVEKRSQRDLFLRLEDDIYQRQGLMEEKQKAGKKMDQMFADLEEVYVRATGKIYPGTYIHFSQFHWTTELEVQNKKIKKENNRLEAQDAE